MWLCEGRRFVAVPSHLYGRLYCEAEKFYTFVVILTVYRCQKSCEMSRQCLQLCLRSYMQDEHDLINEMKFLGGCVQLTGLLVWYSRKRSDSYSWPPILAPRLAYNFYYSRKCLYRIRVWSLTKLDKVLNNYNLVWGLLVANDREWFYPFLPATVIIVHIITCMSYHLGKLNNS